MSKMEEQFTLAQGRYRLVTEERGAYLYGPSQYDGSGRTQAIAITRQDMVDLIAVLDRAEQLMGEGQ